MSNRRKPTALPAQRTINLASNVQEHLRKIEAANPTRVNAYRCTTCAGIVTSVDLDPGVTPMFSPCFATQGCDGQMVSAGYPQHVDLIQEYGQPTLEWHRPASLLGLSAGVIEHVRQGGLVRRATAGAPAWVKELAG